MERFQPKWVQKKKNLWSFGTDRLDSVIGHTGRVIVVALVTLDADEGGGSKLSVAYFICRLLERNLTGRVCHKKQ